MSRNRNPAISARVQFLHAASAIMPQPLSRFYGATYKHLAKRVVYRCPIEIKRTTCKRCDVFLDEKNSTTSLENGSKGQKPHADVKVIRCNACGGMKRFPMTPRVKKERPKKERKGKGKRRHQ